MQKVCALILLTALLANNEAHPQVKWSRPIRNTQVEFTRERRQFPFSEWIPLNKPCPTCRPLVDPVDVNQKDDSIGLTPPRPPTVTRQIHGEGNYFAQDDSAVLSVPPPPPGGVPRHHANPNGNFQNIPYQNVGHFSSSLPVPTQQIFPQSQALQFISQPFLTNQNLLVNSNQPILPPLQGTNAPFNQNTPREQLITNDKIPNFGNNFNHPKFTENVVLEQNLRPLGPHSQNVFPSKPAPFSKPQTILQQNQQQTYVQQQPVIQQQPVLQQQQHSANFANSILTPPPVNNISAQGNVLPGVDKEEIQLLYVPVETLRQRGNYQQQLLFQQKEPQRQQQQSIQFQNRPNHAPKPSSFRPTEPTTTTSQLPSGHFVTLTNQGQSTSSLKLTSANPFATAQTPSKIFFQNSHIQQTPRPFVSATPVPSTSSSFVTPSPFTQQYSTGAPETTFSQLSTVQNSIQYSQPEFQYGTTPKSVIGEEGLREEIITGKPQYDNFPNQNYQQQFVFQQQHKNLQPPAFLNQEETSERQTHQNNIFSQQNTKIRTSAAKQSLPGQQPALPKQQDQLRLFQQQKELQEQLLAKQRQQKETEELRLLEQKRQKQLEEQRLFQKQQRQKELDEQIRNQFEENRRKQLEEQRRRQLEEQRRKQLEEQKQKQIEEQRIKQLEEQRIKQLEEQRIKQLEEQRIKQLEEQRIKQLEEQRIKQFEEQRIKQLEEERIRQFEEQRIKQLKEQQEKQLEEQRQKQIEEQRKKHIAEEGRKQLEEERRKTLEEQRRRQLEDQRRKQLEKQKLQVLKELEEQRYLLLQQEKEAEQERILQQERLNELEEQRRLQRLKEDREKRVLYQKQREQDEKHLIQWQQQQKDLEEQRLLNEQQLEQQQLRKQKLENAKEQQQLYQQQNGQKQALEEVQHQVGLKSSQESNKHIFRETDNANLISELEKESETEAPQLIPHQPPLSVFYKGFGKSESRIVDVLRDLRSSKTITVLDQYFEKMPKVFVGPAGLIPPSGYDKFELPYLSNIEANIIDKEIDKLPFFVAPLNFVPPPGYSKIPFPSPHVGSVVVSDESNPSAPVKAHETEVNSSSEEDSTSFAVVGPELPGLINSLEIETTTIKPTTPSLPQTTAQLRNRRPNNSLYRSRKPISKSRLSITTTTTTTTTTSKPDEDSESEGGFRKPFNRFIKRRRPQIKPTTERPIRYQPDHKGLENRQYSIQTKNLNLPAQKQFGDVVEGSRQSIDRTVPQERLPVPPTPVAYRVQQTSIATQNKERGLKHTEENDSNILQSFEDEPYPTGSAKTLTQEIYRPNNLKVNDYHRSSEGFPIKKLQPKVDTSLVSEKLFEESDGVKYTEDSGVNPTVGFFDKFSEEKTDERTSEYTTLPPYVEKKYATESTSQKYTEAQNFKTEIPQTDDQQSTTEFVDDGFTSAFAEISKHHHIPRPQEPTKNYEPKISEIRPTVEISHVLQAPFPENYSSEQNLQEFLETADVKPTQEINYSNKYSPTESSSEEYPTIFGEISKTESSFGDSINDEIKPTVPSFVSSQYTTTTTKSSGIITAEDTTDFDSEENVHTTPVPTKEPLDLQESLTPTEPSSQKSQTHFFETETRKYEEYLNVVKESSAGVTESFPIQSPISSTENIQTTESQSENYDDSSHRLKLPNPAIVKVRTRVRNKQRGQVNFSTFSSTTVSPIIRSRVENKYTEKADQDNNKPQSFHDSQYVKTSKYHNFRVGKKPVRPTTESTTETEQRSHVYTVRPHKRVTNPSTVSTKRIRKPTSPLPTVEPLTKTYTPFTPVTYSEEPEFQSSGVSNDVYYEHSSFLSTRHKSKKPIDSTEQKSETLPTYEPAGSPLEVHTYSTDVSDDSSADQKEFFTKEDDIEVLEQEPVAQDSSESYPQRDDSESDAEVSDVIVTTVRTNNPEKQIESEELKKFQEGKKAFDPDLEKKNGRRRVRVRVHKRPHESFETAESQNLRTVANVLIPPTSTYKPVGENNVPLAKNSEFSYGGQKSFGLRNREYFRKRVNLTLTESNVTTQGNAFDAISTQHSSTNSNGGNVTTESGKEFSSELYELNEKNPSEINGGKATRPKFRGFVRKVIKHKGLRKEEHKINQAEEYKEPEIKQQNAELHFARVHQGGFNHTGRFNGTRHKTFVRYVKKNKVKVHNTEASQNAESVKDNLGTEILISSPGAAPENETTPLPQVKVISETVTEQDTGSEVTRKHYPVYSPTEIPEIQPTEELESSNPDSVDVSPTEPPVTQALDDTEAPQTHPVENYEQTESSLVQPTQQYFFGKGTTKLFPVLFQSTKEAEEVFSSKPTEALPAKTTEGRPFFKSRFYQPLKPLYQRTHNSGFFRPRDSITPSLTEVDASEQNEKTNRPSKYKYGKGSSYSTSSEGNSEGRKTSFEKYFGTQNKTKTTYNFETRKYSRNKSKENGFSQFSRNRYTTTGKTEPQTTLKEEKIESVESNESGESDQQYTTPVEDTTKHDLEYDTTTDLDYISTTEKDLKTTQDFVTTTELYETTKNEDQEKFKFTVTTNQPTEYTEAEENKEEEKEEEEEEGEEKEEEEESTTTDHLETTNSPTTFFGTSISELLNFFTTTTTEESSAAKEQETTTIMTTITTTPTAAPTTTTTTPTMTTTTESLEQTSTESYRGETQPDLYRFAKNSFSFDEAENFAGTKNRAYVRNITADIIENTPSFSGPGAEKRNEIFVASNSGDQNIQTTTKSSSEITATEKTEETPLEPIAVELTTDAPSAIESSTVSATESSAIPASDAIGKTKSSKLVKTSTTTKVSHETEICYRGRCIRTKSENPDDDLKLLVDSTASKIENNKT